MGSLIAASQQKKRRPSASTPGAPAPSNSDYAALKRLVKEHGFLDRQPVYYFVKLMFCASLLGMAVSWLWLLRHSGLAWLGAPFLAFAGAQLSLLGHDAAHGAVFKSPKANDALAMVVGNLLNGTSFGWWTASHNEHHVQSNRSDSDPDIDYPMLAFSEEQAAKKSPRFWFILERQHYLVLLLMSFVGLTLRMYSVAYLSKHSERKLEMATLAAYFIGYPLFILSALGPLRGVLFIIFHQMLQGIYLASITAANHWAMPMPSDAEPIDFLRHQATTSRNIAGGRLVDLWYGGLNRQIEHHLFPTMPRNNLRKARTLVRDYCAARGIVYHEVGVVKTYGEIFAVMKRVARSVRELRARSQMVASSAE